ncbi:hypothetical protein B0T26DRAFT_688977, partial [Lasiosphaeria miniovina]
MFLRVPCPCSCLSLVHVLACQVILVDAGPNIEPDQLNQDMAKQPKPGEYACMPHHQSSEEAALSRLGASAGGVEPAEAATTRQSQGTLREV